MIDEPQNLPMGRLDAFDAGSRKLTVQTEFFPRPERRVETKIYFGGALKKVFTADASAIPEDQLQKFVNDCHQRRLDELMNNLRNPKPAV